MRRDLVGREHRGDEGVVLGLSHRAVDVIVAAAAPSRRPEGNFHVDRLGGHDGRDRVVEIEMPRADETIQIGFQRRAGERAAGEDGHSAGNRGDFFTHDLDHRMGGERVGQRAREFVAVHRERRAGRNASAIGGGDDQRAEPAHLFLEHADRGVHRIAAQRVRAHQFAEERGLMRLGHARRAHLEQPHAHAASRELPRRLAAREAQRRLR